MILRTIHIGLSGRGQWLLETIAKETRFRPVALVDANTTLARTAQYRLGAEAGHKNVPVFSGVTGALSQVEADAAIICTPTRTHLDTARLAMSANQHVLLDRPLTHDWAESNALVGEADTAWLKLAVAQEQRYTSVEQTISYILNKPDHPYHPGAIRMVDFVNHRYRPEPGDWDYPYAAVWDVACDHMDSLARWLGNAKRVTARSYLAPWSHYVHEANLSAFIEYENGAACNYILTNDATMQQWRVTLQGDRGGLVLTNHERLRFYPKPGQSLGSSEAESIESELMDVPDPAWSIVDDLFRYIVEDVEPGISGKRNLETLRMCEALIRSAKNKRPVELSELK
ncbi:MAG TPA: Gfo/Idh/MocA family oxidoreductase [Tepidisphaeraceae bacterium]|jgi:predicted dehydrogenase